MAEIEANRLQNLHRYWCAANYLTIAQIYLQENPLLRKLRPTSGTAAPRGAKSTSRGLQH
ncbi:MAG TPA: hypothetical protein VFJ58_16210 [Armatimonadota bacterium]|nr:hypothetical protein [Armatimonadota bacterium]